LTSRRHVRRGPECGFPAGCAADRRGAGAENANIHGRISQFTDPDPASMPVISHFLGVGIEKTHIFR
jgi:hypothetical protein